jgi:hypothetical protein
MRPRLDGTNIYMTLARLFLEHATNTPLAFGQEMSVLVIAMLQVGSLSAPVQPASTDRMHDHRQSKQRILRRTHL